MLPLELIADILLNSKFAAGDLDRERVVIQQEIAGTDDNPDDLVFDLMQSAAFPDQAIGRPILGTKASVGRFHAADLNAYLGEHYLPDAIVVSAAGAVHHEHIVRHVEALFGGLTQGRRGSELQARYRGGFAAAGKTFEQSHVLIGLPSPSCLEPEFYTAQVFSGLFGGGMSSRLFQEIREDRGLCYSIYSTVWGVKDTGMLAVHAATGPEMVEELAAVVAQELAALAEAGPTDAELQRSKAQLKAGLLMALESSSVNAEQMARQLLAQGRLVAISELIDEVENVDHRRIKAFAGRLRDEIASVAVIGSGRKSADRLPGSLHCSRPPRLVLRTARERGNDAVAFLRTTRPEEDFEVIRGRNVVLRQPSAADYAAWAELRALSRAHLTPWEPTWAPDDLSRNMYRRRLRAYAKDVRDDTSYPYFIFEGSAGILVGGITLSNVRRGSAQTASLGYWMGAPHAGLGTCAMPLRRCSRSRSEA